MAGFLVLFVLVGLCSFLMFEFIPMLLSHLFSYETHEHGSGAEESSLDPSWQKKSVTRTWWRFKQAVDNKEILQNSVK